MNIGINVPFISRTKTYNCFPAFAS